MTLTTWMNLVQAELQSARDSGIPDLWHTDFKTRELEPVLREIDSLSLRSAAWTAGEAPPPRYGSSEATRACLVTCERKGMRFVTKGQYHFGLKRWFFDDPPSGAIRIVAWMDAPPPYQAMPPA